MAEIPAEVLERAARVRLLLLDVDGVLTDGRILMYSGGAEGRAFHVRDGLGIGLGRRAGLEFGLISGRRSEVVARRAEELDLTEVHQGVSDKAGVLRRIAQRHGLEPGEVGFMGDDVVDVPAMRAAGFAAAPSDAHPDAAQAAHWVTRAAGGRGAVREIVELLLQARSVRGNGETP